jgi:hypothetical protein
MGNKNKLVEKWNKARLLDGIKDENIKENLAEILENESKHLRNAIALSSTKQTSIKNDSIDDKMDYQKIYELYVKLGNQELIDLFLSRYRNKIKTLKDFVLPFARKVLPSLLTSSIVSVQPMQQSNNSIFYLDFTYKKKNVRKRKKRRD